MKRFLLLTLAAAASLRAQTPPPPVADPAPGTEHPVSSLKEIYVPYDQLEKVFTDGGKGVFLPYKEFLDLWNQLTLKRDEDSKPPPTDGVVARAEYVGRVEGQTLVLDATILAESFKTKGWTTLSFGSKTLAGISETNTGKAVLRTKPDGTAELLLPEKGQYSITLKLMLPIVTENGKSRVELALPQATVSKLLVTVPGDGLNFEVKPSAAFTTRALGGQTELSFFFGGPAAAPEISWGAPQAVTQMTPLLLSDANLTSTLRAGTISTNATISLRILRAPMSEFKLSFPTTSEVLGVTGENIKAWNVLPGANGRSQLIITASKPIENNYTLGIELASPIAALPAEVVVPDVQIEGASYARGNASIHTEPQFDVTPKSLEAVVRASTAAQAPNGLLSAGSYRLLKQPWKLSITVEEAKPQVEITSMTKLDIARDAANTTTDFTYKVKRVGIFESRIALPTGITISDVTGSNVGEWKVDADMLTIKMPGQQQGEFSIKLTARQLRTRPTDDVIVPVFAPQNVARHEATIGVTVHSSLEANTKTPGDLQQEDVDAAPVLSISNATPQNQAHLGFRYRDTAKAPAVLSFKARDPQVSVQVLTLVEAKEQSTKHAWTLDFNVSYAAIDKLVLAVPKAVANDLRLIDPSIKEIIKDFKADDATTKKTPDAANYAFWQVVLRGEKVGAFQLTVTHEKIGALEAGKSGTIELLQVHVPEAFQEVGQIAVLKDNALELRNAQHDGLEEIDTRELTGALAKPGVFQAYKYRALPIKLSIDTVKNDYFKVPQAVITHADLTTAIATDQAESTEVIYWVKNIDLQFLVVKLPAKAKLVSDVFVGKEAQQPMRREGSEDLLVRLPTGGSTHRESFAVRFVYQLESPGPGTGLGTWGRIPIQVPAVAEKIFEARHRLYLPDGQDYTAFEGPLAQDYAERGWPHIIHTFKRALWWLPVDTVFSLVFRSTDSLGNSQWSDPPQIPGDVRNTFDFQVPQQGHLEVLRRLGAPSDITTRYRSRTLTFFWEALAFVLVAGAGVLGLKWSSRRKLAFLISGVLVSMLLIALLNPANAVFGVGMVRGLGVVMLLWVALGLKNLLAAIKLKRSQKPKPPPSSNGSGNGGNQGPQLPPHPLGEALRDATAPTTGGATTVSSSGPTEFIQVPEVGENGQSTSNE